MRSINLIIILLLLFAFTSCHKYKNEFRTLTVTIDESINSQPQWVYWTSLYGNEFNIIDSCYIEKGQTEFILRDTIMNDSINGWTELIFSEVLLPWEYSVFKIDANDKNICINNLTSKGLYANGSTIEGSLAEKESRDISLRKREKEREIWRLKEKFMSTDYNDTITLSRITNEIEDLQKYLTMNFIINQFDSVQSTTVIADLIYELSRKVLYNGAPRSVLDSIGKILNQKYPSDAQIQIAIKTHINGEPTPSASPRSKYWEKRRNEIRYIAHNKQRLRKSDGSTSFHQQPEGPPGVYKNERDTTNVPVYTLGTKIGPLKLKDPKNKLSSISDIRTDYILIDFWATWCVPCIRQIPEIKAVHDKYKNKLTVYAISLDNSEVEWKESIEKYKCRQFNHVYAGSWAGEDAKLITNSFGITAIPSNFLLDKDRQIVAVDLNGKELENIIKNLTK